MTHLSATEQTKQNIIDAFWLLYQKGGMSQVTITKICQKAGYNRSTFYAYFKDAYDVLETLEQQLFSPDHIMEELIFPLMHANDPTQLFEGIITLFDSLSPYLPVLLSEYGDPLFRRKLLDLLAPVLYKRFSSSDYTERALSYIFEYQNAALLATIARWYQNGKDIPKETLIKLLITLTQNGLKHTLLST